MATGGQHRRPKTPSLNFPPVIKAPRGLELWQLGRKKHWDELEALLKPMEGFRVTSAAAEAYLAKCRKSFDKSASPSHGQGIIHILLDTLGGDNNVLLEKLLALGLNPDLEANEKLGFNRPSHRCVSCARPKCARSLCLCRPNLQARTKSNLTPFEGTAGALLFADDDPNFPETERTKLRQEVAQVWEAAENEGFPTVSEMASKKQWFAVMNLCRRGVVGNFAEGLVRYQGKTTVEWAVHHGEKSLAEELRYYLERSSSDMAVTLHDEAQQTAARLIDMGKQLEASASKLRQEAQEELDRREAAEGTSHEVQQEAMKGQVQALRNESKDRQEEVDLDVVAIQSMLGSNRQICEAGQGNMACQLDALRQNFVQLLDESEVRHEGEMRIFQNELDEKDKEHWTLRHTVDKMTERQKGLEDDVDNLEKALEAANSERTGHRAKRRDRRSLD